MPDTLNTERGKLFLSHARQMISPVGNVVESHDFPKTPLSVETERVEFLPSFDIFGDDEFSRPVMVSEDDNTYEGLQRRFNKAEMDGNDELANALGEELERKFSEIEVETDFGKILKRGNWKWALRYSLTFCAYCCHKLRTEGTSNTRLCMLTWYSPPCGHALRYCENCKDKIECLMCLNGGKKEKVIVFQALDEKMGVHKNCVVKPCDTCRYF